MKAILLFGPPGAGKGTQGSLLGKKKKYVHFSMGELFRELEHHGDLGKKVSKYVENRELVPDHLTMELFDAEIQRRIRSKRYDPDHQVLLLDGIPRDRHQVAFINQRFKVIAIINLYCKDKNEIMKRIMKRAGLQHREDDSQPAVIRHGLDVYHERTEEILKEYPKRIIMKIDAQSPIGTIHREILTKLKGF